MAVQDVPGPIDFVLIEFGDAGPLDGPAAALLDLVEAGTIRLYDLVVLRRSDDGSPEALEIGPDSGFGDFRGAQSGLLGDEDVAQAAQAMEPGTTAVLIVYENAWAIPFVAAVRDAGGEMIATARIPGQDLIDALDELEGVS